MQSADYKLKSIRYSLLRGLRAFLSNAYMEADGQEIYIEKGGNDNDNRKLHIPTSKFTKTSTTSTVKSPDENICTSRKGRTYQVLISTIKNQYKN